MQTVLLLKSSVSPKPDRSHFELIMQSRHMQMEWDAIAVQHNCSSLQTLNYSAIAGSSSSTEQVRRRICQTNRGHALIRAHGDFQKSFDTSNHPKDLPLAWNSYLFQSHYRLAKSSSLLGAIGEYLTKPPAAVAPFDVVASALFEPVALIEDSGSLTARRARLPKWTEMNEFMRIARSPSNRVVMMDVDHVNAARSTSYLGKKRLYERHLEFVEKTMRSSATWADLARESFKFRIVEDALMDRFLHELVNALRRKNVRTLFFGGDAIAAIGDLDSIAACVASQTEATVLSISLTVAEAAGGNDVFLNLDAEMARRKLDRDAVT